MPNTEVLGRARDPLIFAWATCTFALQASSLLLLRGPDDTGVDRHPDDLAGMAGGAGIILLVLE